MKTLRPFCLLHFAFSIRSKRRHHRDRHKTVRPTPVPCKDPWAFSGKYLEECRSQNAEVRMIARSAFSILHFAFTAARRPLLKGTTPRGNVGTASSGKR